MKGINREPEAYFITLIHTTGFLKDEITRFYPKWHFKSGQKGFMTYTIDREYDLQSFRSMKTIFCLTKGLLLKRGTRAELEGLLPTIESEWETHTIHRWDLMNEEGEMGDRKNRGNVIDFVRLGEDEFALGVRFQIRGDFAPYSEVSPIPMPLRAPTLAYQKVGEAFKHFRPLVAHDDVFLDIGCSPGGSTYYLLKKGYRVIGVDPKPLDPSVTEDFPEGFIHLKQNFNELKVKHLKGLPPVNWILFDVDTDPIPALEVILKLVNKLEECRGLIMTIKMDHQFDLENLHEIEDLAASSELVEVRMGLLPSNEKEFCLVLSRMD